MRKNNLVLYPNSLTAALNEPSIWSQNYLSFLNFLGSKIMIFPLRWKLYNEYIVIKARQIKNKIIDTLQNISYIYFMFIYLTSKEKLLIFIKSLKNKSKILALIYIQQLILIFKTNVFTEKDIENLLKSANLGKSYYEVIKDVKLLLNSTVKLPDSPINFLISCFNKKKKTYKFTEEAVNYLTTGQKINVNVQKIAREVKGKYYHDYFIIFAYFYLKMLHFRVERGKNGLKLIFRKVGMDEIFTYFYGEKYNNPKFDKKTNQKIIEKAFKEALIIFADEFGYCIISFKASNKFNLWNFENVYRTLVKTTNDFFVKLSKFTRFLDFKQTRNQFLYDLSLLFSRENSGYFNAKMILKQFFHQFLGRIENYENEVFVKNGKNLYTLLSLDCLLDEKFIFKNFERYYLKLKPNQKIVREFTVNFRGALV